MTDVPGSQHTISIVTPVYDPSRAAFEKCVTSVLTQSYPHWEWCLVDDCSTAPWVWKRLRRLARRHSNIKIHRRSSNGGISRATNDAIDLATSQFIAFLDHDDVLHRDALAVVNHELHLDPKIDFLYTDEDKIDDRGEHFEVFRKPAWSPERLLGQNYCNHLTIVRAELVRQLGGLREGYEGAQDHDFVLRLSELPINVAHVDRVLYHWRAAPGSHAAEVDAKPYTEAAMRRAVTDACQRRGIDADLVSTPQGYLRVRRRPHHRPPVSVVIPTRGTVGSVWGLEVPYIENLLLSIASRSTYPHVEFVVVFDTGTEQGLLERLVDLPLDVKLVEFSGRFNFSKKCNIGTLHSSGDRLIFLNDDMELITPDWIECLVAMLEEPDVGAVGPLLLYENGLIQSAGHINPGPVHFARGMSPSSPVGAAWPLVLNREVSGITGACMAMRRETFLDCGGFSELFAEAFNDVDLCFKLMAAGYRILWTPDVQLFHFESKSRIPDVDLDAISDLMRYWGRHVEQGKSDQYTTL